MMDSQKLAYHFLKKMREPGGTSLRYNTCLVPTQRLLKAGRNMSVGDVVLIKYKNKSFPGSYRLCRVKHVEIDPIDGLVRTCIVIYKLIKPASKDS